MKRKAVMRGKAWPAGMRAGQARDSGALRLRRGLAAQPQRGETDPVDEIARVEPGSGAAASGVVLLQGGVPGRGTQELVHLGQHVRQVGQLRLADPAGHGAVSGVVPNPAQAEVPGWAEYTSSAMVTGPAAFPAAWYPAMDSRSPPPTRPASAAVPSAASTAAVPASEASSTASAILARIRAAPTAAASVSQARAPSPIARNAASACLAGRIRGGRGVPSGCCGWSG